MNIRKAVLWTACLAALAGFANPALAARVYPNPAHVADGDTQVTFDELGSATIEIYTVQGQLVRRASAESVFQWDLKNDSGREVASGVYFYVIEQGGGSVSGKVVVIR